MGEYATVNGERVKIGTCEDMYYLRFDQRHKVTAESGNVDPVRDAPSLRFRFPWPDEDHVAPGGGFHDAGFERSVCAPGFTAPPGVEHGTVQFVAHAGYNVCLPCPESDVYRDDAGARTLWQEPRARVHRNGFSGAVHLACQKFVPGKGLVPVLRCGGCGTMWREEDPAEIERLAVAFRSEADRRERMGQRNGTGAADRMWWDGIADRVLAGLLVTA